MIAPGADGIEVGFELGVVEFCCNAFTLQLRIPVRVEHVDHHHADADGIDSGPRLRLVVQEAKLGWKGILVLSDVEVHAARAGAETRTLIGRQIRVDALRGVAELEHALCFIVAQQRGAEDFGEFSVGAAAIGVHLPEAVLRSHVALRDKQILLRSGVDVRDPVLVSTNADGGGEAGKVDVSVELRESGFCSGAEPENADRGQQPNKDEHSGK